MRIAHLIAVVAVPPRIIHHVQGRTFGRPLRVGDLHANPGCQWRWVDGEVWMASRAVAVNTSHISRLAGSRRCTRASGGAAEFRRSGGDGNPGRARAWVWFVGMGGAPLPWPSAAAVVGRASNGQGTVPWRASLRLPPSQRPCSPCSTSKHGGLSRWLVCVPP